MNLIFPNSPEIEDILKRTDSSILYHDQTSNEFSPFITSLLLNIANEAATSQLRTVFIRKEPLLRHDFVHIHGGNRLVASNWDNIHFVYPSNEAGLISWFSRVHLSHRFADLIIIEGLDQFCTLNNTYESIYRLLSLFEETRQFIHSITKSTEHGHQCGLVVSCCLNKLPNIKLDYESKSTPQLPAHCLMGTYVLTKEESTEEFMIHSIESKFSLCLRKQYDEFFWTKCILIDKLLSLSPSIASNKIETGSSIAKVTEIKTIEEKYN